jgi:cell division protein FtsQ
VIGRRKKRGAEAAPDAEWDADAIADDALPTIQQPAIPPLDGEPSEQVLDELLTFFGVRHGHHRRRTGEVPAMPPPTTAPPPAPPAEPADAASPSHEPAPAIPSATSAASRVLGGDDLDAADGLPLADNDLVPAPTRRAERRSRKEAKREEKLAEKRLAKLAKQQAAADKAAAKEARRAGGQRGKGAPSDPGAGSSLDGGESVRILPGPGPGTGQAAGVGADAGTSGGAETSIPPPPPVAPIPPPPTAPPAAAETPAARTTVSIGGDDLPDAVYIAGELDPAASAERGPATVFIDDKDPATGAVVSMEVAASAGRIEPRIRDRRIAVRRAVGRKRLKWAALAVAAAGVVVAVLAVLGSGLFAIEHVTVEGAIYSRGDALDAVVAELQGDNVLRVDTEAAERQLELIPWVADARVRTDFPNGAVIELRERRPVLAYEGADQHFRVLDGDGRVLEVLDGQPVGYLALVVDPVPASNKRAGAFAPRGYAAAAALATSLGPLREQVASISVDSDGEDLRLGLVNGLEVRFGAAENLEVKLVRLQTALQNANPDNPPTEMIDVSTNPYIMR